MSEYCQIKYQNISDQDLSNVLKPSMDQVVRLTPQLYRTEVGEDPPGTPVSIQIPLPRTMRVSVSSIDHKPGEFTTVNFGGENALEEAQLFHTRCMNSLLDSQFVAMVEQNISAAKCRTANDIAAVNAAVARGDSNPADAAPVETVIAGALPAEEAPVDGTPIVPTGEAK